MTEENNELPDLSERQGKELATAAEPEKIHEAVVRALEEQKTAEPAKVHLKDCACGKTPSGLVLQAQKAAKYGMATGMCCRRWYVEFANYFEEEPNAILINASKAWNDAPRATNTVEALPSG